MPPASAASLTTAKRIASGVQTHKPLPQNPMKKPDDLFQFMLLLP